MIFVDSNVVIYAVGRPHPMREEARRLFLGAAEEGRRLVTSAEVFQELLHVYLPVKRYETLDAALELLTEGVDQVFPVEKEDVLSARLLADRYPTLAARDLLHLALCRRRGVSEIWTFDRGLASAFGT